MNRLGQAIAVATDRPHQDSGAYCEKGDRPDL